MSKKLIPAIIFRITILMVCMTPVLSQVSEFNKDLIRKLYMEGEFEKVIIELEPFRKTSSQLNKSDKIFLFKHLSVVYAAKPETRDKAESYMYQLLKLVPTIELLDMYISDTIANIFNDVKEDYHNRLSYLETQKQSQDQHLSGSSTSVKQKGTTSTGNKSRNKEEKKSYRWIWWTAGGVVVAGGVAAYVLYDNSPEVNRNTIEIGN